MILLAALTFDKQKRGGVRSTLLSSGSQEFRKSGTQDVYEFPSDPDRGSRTRRQTDTTTHSTPLPTYAEQKVDIRCVTPLL